MSSGTQALIEGDGKKVIALSTLSQLRIIMISVFINIWKMSFFHLITHALFKSILFISRGFLIFSRYGNQSSSTFNKKSEVIFIIICLLSSFNLIGVPLLSGFISKDMIIETIVRNQQRNISMFFVLACCLTLFYTVRIIKILFIK